MINYPSVACTHARVSSCSHFTSKKAIREQNEPGPWAWLESTRFYPTHEHYWIGSGQRYHCLEKNFLVHTQPEILFLLVYTMKCVGGLLRPRPGLILA